MAGQEPIVRVNVRFAANHAETVASAARIEAENAVNQLHAPARQAARIVQWQSGECRAETARQIAAPQGVKLRVAIRFNAAHRRERLPIRRRFARHSAQVHLRKHQPLAFFKVARRKKSGAALRHGQNEFTVHAAFEAETEQVRRALPEKFVNVNVMPNRLARVRQIAVKRHRRIKQPIDRQPFRDEINPQIAGQKEVGLAGFDGDADGNAPAVEIPRAR